MSETAVKMLRSGGRLGKLGSFRAPAALSRHAQPGSSLGLKLKDRRWASTSTVTALESYPAAGEKLHGFIVQQKKHIPELHLSAIHLKHEKTDADYLHVARDDKNNVFGISFKTNPPDATGVPHILEHTTLCGSEKSVYQHLPHISVYIYDGSGDRKMDAANRLLLDIPFETPFSRCCHVHSLIS